MPHLKFLFESDGTGVVGSNESTLLFLFPGVWHHCRPVGREAMKMRWLGSNDDIAYRLPGRQFMARVLDFIRTSSHRGVTMDQLCHLVGAPRRTVERRFRAARGHSLLTDGNLCRCRRARLFLETADLPARNFCWLAGFSNTGRMRVIFLRLLGMTPTHYRRNHRGRHSRGS